jgi:hypothetical protein
MRLQILILAMVFGVLGAPAGAKMAAQTVVPASKLVAFLEKKKPRSAEDRDTLVLARVAAAAFDASVSFPYEENDNSALATAQPGHVVIGMSNALDHYDWSKPVDPRTTKLVRKNEALFTRRLTPGGGTLWVWFQRELGHKDEARAAALKLFDAEYDRVMKLDKNVIAFGRGPLREAEIQFAALKTLAKPDELPALTDMLQKMKVHVSTLPQSTIMT